MHYTKYGDLSYDDRRYFPLDHDLIEGFSPLFYRLKATWWDLDKDGDMFLSMCAKRFWLPTSDNAEAVYLKALISEEARLEKEQEDFFNQSSHLKAKYSRDLFDIITDDSDDEHPDDIKFMDYSRKRSAITDKFELFLPEFLRTLIEDDFLYHGQITMPDSDSTLYSTSIARHPGRFLLSYFHDQIVFMNYVQNIVPHKGAYTEGEIKLLFLGDLLSYDNFDRFRSDVLNRIFRTVRTSYRSWWT